MIDRVTRVREIIVHLRRVNGHVHACARSFVHSCYFVLVKSSDKLLNYVLTVSGKNSPKQMTREILLYYII